MAQETTLLIEVIWFAAFAAVEALGMDVVYRRRKMWDIIAIVILAVMMTIQFFTIKDLIFLGAY